ncbi:MAG: phosphate ABC transporter permease family protein, partial [Proteobacteria bacterium]|nr:phosphate ABC transporter permease family protein [Pseudomonadota bacterium]
MESTTLILLLAFFTVVSFYLGRGRALARVGGPGRSLALHSLPGYYGYYVAIWTAVPALFLMLVWTVAEPKLLVLFVINSLPADYRHLPTGELNLLVNN